MAQFRGTMQGNRGETSRLGSKQSGLTARLSGWQGAVQVYLFKDEQSRDCATVRLDAGNAYNAGGPSIVLYSGPIDEAGRNVASGHVPNPPQDLSYQYTAETCPGRPCGVDCDHRGAPPEEQTS